MAPRVLTRVAARLRGAFRRLGPCLALLATLAALAPARASEDTLRTFEACWSTVQRRFYDRDLHGVDWDAVRREFRPLADRARPGRQLHGVLQAMLARLGASHTTILDAAVHQQLMAELRNQRAATFGLLLEMVDGRCFVRDQYENGAGVHATPRRVRRGDEILAVDGVPVARSGALVEAGYDPALGGQVLKFLRVPGDGDWRLLVRSDPQSPPEQLVLEARNTNAVEALAASVQVLPRSGVRLGTFHVWYCSAGVLEAVTGALEGPLAEVDALVVDLRGRGGLASSVAPLEGLLAAWAEAAGGRRPVIYLQDGRTRSAKELWAWRVRQRGTGTLVGERTEGAVLAAGFFPLPDGSYLELAVQDVPVEGTRLEGVGVAPHVPVESWLPYAEGLDLIFETGCHVAVCQVLGEPAPGAPDSVPTP